MREYLRICASVRVIPELEPYADVIVLTAARWSILVGGGGKKLGGVGDEVL